MYYTMFLFHILLYNIKFCLSCLQKNGSLILKLNFLNILHSGNNLKELCDIYQRFHYIIHSFVSQMFGTFFTGIQIFWKISKSKILLGSTIFYFERLFLND